MIANPVATAGTCGTPNATAPAPRVETSSGHNRLSIVRAGLPSGSEACVRALASSDAIGPDVPARLPSQMPIPAAATHQAAANGTSVSSPLFAPPATVTAASRVAQPALTRTVVRRKSAKRTPPSLSDPLLRPRPRASVGRQRREQLDHAVRSIDHEVGLGGDLGRSLIGANSDPDGAGDTALIGQPHKCMERVEVGDVVADVERDVDVRVGQESLDPGTLVDPDRRPDLEHLAPPVGPQTGRLRSRRDRVDRRACGLLVGSATPVEGDDRALVLQAHAKAAQIRRVGLASELVDPLGPIFKLLVDDRLGPARTQDFNAVRAEIRERPDS